MPYHRHNPYMHHVPRVGAYLPGVAGYLPRVGQDCYTSPMVAPAVAAAQGLGAAPAWSAVGDALSQAQIDIARQAILSSAEVPTPRTRAALFLPLSQDNVAVGAFSFQAIPTVDFQLEEVTIGANAGDVEISQISVGIKNTFAGSGFIPGPQFAPNSLASRACRGLVRAGTPISVTGNALVLTNLRMVFSGHGLVDG